MTKLLLISKLTKEAIRSLKQNYEVLLAGSALGGEDELTEDVLKELVLTFQPQILIVDSSPTTKDVLSASNKLDLVICTRGTPNNIDVDYCQKNQIKVCNTPSRNANSVAEFTLGLILSITRYIPQSMQAIKAKKITVDSSELDPNTKDVTWQHTSLPYVPYEKFKGFELTGSTLGLVGLGAIGLLVAQKALYLSMKVKVYDPYVDKKSFDNLDIELVEFEELIAKSDVISIHAKETETTKNIINANVFEAMKPTSFFINTARASLVNYEDLISALKTESIAGAAIDVFPTEPLNHNDPLLNLPNLVLTPHIGGASNNVVDHHTRMVMTSLNQYEKTIPMNYSCIK